MFITIELDLDPEIDAMTVSTLQRIVAPLANAIADAIKPELESLRAQAQHANDLAMRSAEDLTQVNEQRLAAEATVAEQRGTIERQRVQIAYLEAETLKAIDEKDKANADINKKIAELDNVRAKLGVMKDKLRDLVDDLD